MPLTLPTRPPTGLHRTARGGSPRVLRLAGALLVALVLGWLPVAQAMLIDSGDGTGNTTAPAADPGFDNVGATSTNLTAVYVRNGWVLTANHVGDQPVILSGVTYQPLAGSGVRFTNPDATQADLLAYKLQTKPPLPDLAIASAPPTPNTVITMIGNGFGRGAATSWMGVNGYFWLGVRDVRWGTNRITQTAQIILDTQAFTTTFDSGPTPGSQHEADIVNGDSGGAAFVGSGASAELIGILFARGAFEGQPASTSLYGNVGIIADLHAYRSDILALIDQPDCDDGLDNDMDGLADYPADPGCTSASDGSERELTLACDNEIDDDGDGTIDLEDGGCTGPDDTDERGAPWECDNGADDDLDTFSDFPDDPGCLHPTGLYELAAPEPGFGGGLIAGVLALGAASRRARRR